MKKNDSKGSDRFSTDPKNIKDEEFNSTEMRSALKLLMDDETEAVEGYDKVLALPLSGNIRSELEILRNEEISHIKKLSELYASEATGAIDEHVSEELKDTNYVYETDKPKIKWQMHQSENGSYYFKAPDGTRYTSNEQDVVYWSKSAAGKFFIQNLFNKSLWGFEVPKVIIDSESGKRFWVTFGDWGGSRRVVEFDNPVDRKYAENVMKELKVFQENTVGFETKEEADAKIEKLKKGDPNYADEETKYIKFMVVVSDAQAPGNVIKCNGGWCVTADKNWWLLYSPNGFFKYSSTTPESRTVFKTEAEANMVAKEFLRSEFSIKDSNAVKFNSLVKELDGVKTSDELEILRASIWVAMHNGQLSVGEVEELTKKCIKHCLEHNLK